MVQKGVKVNIGFLVSGSLRQTFSSLRHRNYLGGTGPGESSVQFAILLKEFLDLNMKMIYYPSSAENT